MPGAARVQPPGLVQGGFGMDRVAGAMTSADPKPLGISSQKKGQFWDPGIPLNWFIVMLVVMFVVIHILLFSIKVAAEYTPFSDKAIPLRFCTA